MKNLILVAVTLSALTLTASSRQLTRLGRRITVNIKPADNLLSIPEDSAAYWATQKQRNEKNIAKLLYGSKAKYHQFNINTDIARIDLSGLDQKKLLEAFDWRWESPTPAGQSVFDCQTEDHSSKNRNLKLRIRKHA